MNTNKPETMTCPECHGRGMVPSGDGFDEPCRECGGSGRVYNDELETEGGAL
jgi:DnaJ-class molecular chaperone